MSFNLVLNSSNVINDGYNTNLIYNFAVGGFYIPQNSEMCVSLISLPYAFFNINASLYNNSSYQYTFPSSTGSHTYNVVMPNGYYNLNDINNYLQTVMIQNGHYLVDSAGNYVYYMYFVYDTTYYSVQLTCYAFPSSLPSGYSNPNNLTFPSQATTTQLIINNNFGNIIGFENGIYPTQVQNTNTTILSNKTANASPVNSIICRCSLINNNCAQPSDILDSFPLGQTIFGANINYAPNFGKFIKLKQGLYNSLQLSFYDQNLNPIQSQDPNLSITLLIRFNDTSDGK